MRLAVCRESFPDRPAFDTAVSRAILLRVEAGDLPPTLRLHWPGRIVAFGKRDTLEPGYAEAVAIAREHGYAAIERMAGGRAAVYHEATLSMGHAVPDRYPPERTIARFEETAGLIERALRRLGVDARVGEVPGEYCPGGHSVNARGERKLSGTGQRLYRRAAHVGSVIVAGGEDRVRGVLVPVYEALGLSWDPATAGSIGDERGPTPLDEVEEAILAELSGLYELDEASLDRDTLALAEGLAPEHLPV